ncbi:MAG: hypothetical protein ABJF88_14065 [Rhodothermales bacterium]
MLLLALGSTAQAQSARLTEALQLQRAKVRMGEIVGEMGIAIPPRGPAEIETEPSEAASLLFWWLPRSRTPRVALDPIPLVAPAEPAPEPPAPTLGRIRWDRVGPGEQEAFLDRYREALWTVDGMRFFTALDTIPTPKLRSRLFGLFGAPTRTAIARGVNGFNGNDDVQFEYWFVVNDSIPFVALDKDGPFGRGLVLAGDFAHTAVLGALKRDFAEQMMTRARPMPYVDYYHSRERNQWYRTGYDGTDYYVREIERPRWAGRRSESGKWYLFR